MFGPDRLESAWAAANEPCGQPTGTRPRIVVSSPGADRNLGRAPPIASEPVGHPPGAAGPALDPVGVEPDPVVGDRERQWSPFAWASETVAAVAPEYFATLLRASRQVK